MNMFRLSSLPGSTRQACRGCLIRHGLRREFAAAAISTRTRSAQQHPDVLTASENTHGRVISAVKRRIKEREIWQSQLSPEMNSREDIALIKRLRESEPLQGVWDDWIEAQKALHDAQDLLDDPDPDMRDLAASETEALRNKMDLIVSQSIPKLLVPPSSTREYGALVEMKSGVGGEESSLFLGELLRMYLRACSEATSIPTGKEEKDDYEPYRWKTEVVEQNDLDTGGTKSAIFEVRGRGAYDALRFESGIHRVQRVPATEASGRVHTSTVAIIVLPLVEESQEADQGLYKMDDVKIEVMRARGAGGQHVNKTESAVRLTHIPTGITVSMQDERSQHQNKRRAFRVLQSRLLDIRVQQEQADAKAARLSLVRSADRSEKIRTYNWAQDRVTDHRIGFSIMNLEKVMEGDGLVDFLVALRKKWEEEKMAEILDG